MTSDVSKHRAVRQHHATSRPGSTRSRPRGECDCCGRIQPTHAVQAWPQAAGRQRCWAGEPPRQPDRRSTRRRTLVHAVASLCSACGIWMLRILWKGRRGIFNCLSSLAVLPDKLGSNEHKAVRFCSLWQDSTEIQLSRFGKCKENNQAVKGAPI